jgi:hypothetical protein
MLIKHLNTELVADGALGGWGTGHLDGNDTTKWSSAGWVDKLDHADTSLPTDGTSAGGTGWDSSREGVVLVDVGGTLHDAKGNQGAGKEAALLRGGNVALGTWDLLGDIKLGASGESAGTLVILLVRRNDFDVESTSLR